MDHLSFREEQVKEWTKLFSRCESCKKPFEFRDKETKIRINKYYFCVDCAETEIDSFIEDTKNTIIEKQRELCRKHFHHCPCCCHCTKNH